MGARFLSFGFTGGGFLGRIRGFRGEGVGGVSGVRGL
jgi:hypothetical protein